MLLTMVGGRLLISFLYRTLREDIPSGRLMVQLTEKEWYSVHVAVQITAGIVRAKLIQYNIIHQVYLTPAIFHVLYPERTSACPRCSMEQADFLHMLRGCQALDMYWQAVINWMNSATGWLVLKDPKHCLLGLLPVRKKKTLSTKFLVLWLVLAKLRIAIHWLSPSPQRYERGRESWLSGLWPRRGVCTNVWEIQKWRMIFGHVFLFWWRYLTHLMLDHL